MKYRIIERTSGKGIEYTSQRKGWFFWHNCDQDLYYDSVCTNWHPTFEEAKEALVQQIARHTRLYAKTQTRVVAEF